MSPCSLWLITIVKQIEMKNVCVPFLVNVPLEILLDRLIVCKRISLGYLVLLISYNMLSTSLLG